MDHFSCNVIYVNRLVGEHRLIRAVPADQARFQKSGHTDWRRDQAREWVKSLLDIFGVVHLCTNGPQCLSALSNLQDESMTTITPTLILIDIPSNDRLQERHDESQSASPTQASASQIPDVPTQDEELYGLGLLQKIIAEARLRSLSKLVVPLPVISHSGSTESGGDSQMTDGTFESSLSSRASLAAERRLIRMCLDIGAVDVFISPLTTSCITALEICAYKAHRDATQEQRDLLAVTKGRKRSWVGVNEQKPFAYLREAMVSGLMNGICRLDSNEGQMTSRAHVEVSSERRSEIARAVGQWRFCAHSFSDDELLIAALIMFQHALAVPELLPWRMSADQLVNYLAACRAAYNSFVPYHNFRHVVDVLQATFNFLVQIGALPPFPDNGPLRAPLNKSRMATLLSPFESLTLLITAIGHDVGHPGVNNGFLTTLNAPLAQLYNDRSVLESFHCAAYSQILRRYWPSAFEDRKLRKLMISSILATDMGLHFDYMKKLNDLKDHLGKTSSSQSWHETVNETYRTLACSLLIKCADISNVARHHETALKWMHILSEEFSRQASMEAELEIESSLIAPPKKDILSLSSAQLGFMSLFAIPLFQGVADILPAMQYTVDELEINKSLFERKVQDEQAKQKPGEESHNKRRVWDSTLPSTRATDIKQAGGKTIGAAESVGSASARVPTVAPQAAADVITRNQQQAPLASDEPADLSDSLARDQEALPRGSRGAASLFDAVQDPADSDPVSPRSKGEAVAEGKASAPFDRQRCSETTEGSAAGTFAGDWQSQATTATTGKVALSPSTQGTSIVSNESVERRPSATGPNISPPSASSHGSPGTVMQEGGAVDDDLSAGGVGKAEGKSVRKKTSRFRMKDLKDQLSFFRRHKTSSPPTPASDRTS